MIRSDRGVCGVIDLNDLLDATEGRYGEGTPLRSSTWSRFACYGQRRPRTLHGPAKDSLPVPPPKGIRVAIHDAFARAIPPVGKRPSAKPTSSVWSTSYRLSCSGSTRTSNCSSPPLRPAEETFAGLARCRKPFAASPASPTGHDSGWHALRNEGRGESANHARRSSGRANHRDHRHPFDPARQTLECFSANRGASSRSI